MSEEIFSNDIQPVDCIIKSIIEIDDFKLIVCYKGLILLRRGQSNLTRNHGYVFLIFHRPNKPVRSKRFLLMSDQQF
jgi:hypothetical protein